MAIDIKTIKRGLQLLSSHPKFIAKRHWLLVGQVSFDVIVNQLHSTLLIKITNFFSGIYDRNTVPTDGV